MDPHFINYKQTTPPSLKSTAIVSIVTRLMAQRDIKNELLRLDSREQSDRSINVVDFSKIEEKIVGKLNLMVPKNLHNEIIDFVKPIGLQLLKCFDQSNEEYYDLYHHDELDGSLVWSADGTINKIQTLKYAILDETRINTYRSDSCMFCCEDYMLVRETVVFENNTRMAKCLHNSLFKLACKYCCEESVLKLWGEMRTECQVRLQNEHDEEDYLTVYWIRTLKLSVPLYIDDGYQYHISNHDMVRICVSKGNIIAVKYFESAKKVDFVRSIDFQRFLQMFSCHNSLVQEPKFSRYQEPNEYADILFFLLADLKYQDEQKSYFQLYTKVVLKSLFLHWPWQKYFLPTINVMWDYLKKSLYVEIMSTIAAEAKDKNSSEILLIEVLRISPKVFKKSLVLHSWNNSNIMRKLLHAEQAVADIESLHDIFAEEGKTIDNYKILLYLIDLRSFEFIGKYMQWYITSDEKLNEFKAQFVREKISELLGKFSKQDDGLSMFKEFIECFCCTDNENFKENCYEHTMKVVKKGYFNFATRVLASCNKDLVDIALLKKEMMISPFMTSFFLRFLQHSHGSNVLFEDAHWKEMKNVIKWFSPFSNETADELKSKLGNCFHKTLWTNKQVASEKMELLFYLLDVFVTENSLEYDNYICDYDYTLQEENIEEDNEQGK